MDVGTGDGRFVLDTARAQPETFIIGIDPVASAMAEASRRAAVKPVRGGLDNAMFVLGSLETLDGALRGLADRLTVNYPWGSLLRAVAVPDADLLTRLAGLAKPGATLDILVNMQPLRDAANALRLGLGRAAIVEDEAHLKVGYAKAGWALKTIEDVTGRTPPVTRWGQQLHFAGREIRRLRAVRSA